ncbi:MAG: hypothetical protein HC908_05785 [Calothrix sp. SM1_7_51]|nr:hypothetical protein [Calothrix sp. SM1_7_51]
MFVDFLTTLAARTLSLAPLVQPAIAFLGAGYWGLGTGELENREWGMDNDVDGENHKSQFNNLGNVSKVSTTFGEVENAIAQKLSFQRSPETQSLEAQLLMTSKICAINC